MNLFRSEEHVNNWSQYDPISEEAITPLADWALLFGGPMFRSRLEPDNLSRTGEYMSEFFDTLHELGREGPFWQSE